MNIAVEILKTAKRLIEKPGKFTNKAAALDSRGSAVAPWSAFAVRRSVWGAVMAQRTAPAIDRREAVFLLSYTSPHSSRHPNIPTADVMVGDRKATHAEALRWLDDAITNGEAEERDDRPFGERCMPLPLPSPPHVFRVRGLKRSTKVGGKG